MNTSCAIGNELSWQHLRRSEAVGSLLASQARREEETILPRFTRKIKLRDACCRFCGCLCRSSGVCNGSASTTIPSISCTGPEEGLPGQQDAEEVPDVKIPRKRSRGYLLIWQGSSHRPLICLRVYGVSRTRNNTSQCGRLSRRGIQRVKPTSCHSHRSIMQRCIK